MRAFIITFVGEKQLELKPGLNLAGRSNTCDLVVDHKSVSSHHCVLALMDGSVRVRDLDSSNSTQVNGRPVKKGILQDGDILALASIRFRVAIIREEGETDDFLI